MKSFYPLCRSIGCCVPAPSVRFGVGAWMVIARQSPWGKGAMAGEEARRGREAALDFRFKAGSNWPTLKFDLDSTLDTRPSTFSRSDRPAVSNVECRVSNPDRSERSTVIGIVVEGGQCPR